MNPFRDWLPMYGEEAVPEMPWWRKTQWPSRNQLTPGFKRCDGVQCFPRQVSLRDWLGEFRSLDERTPILVPPPMAGQVWVSIDDSGNGLTYATQQQLLDVEPAGWRRKDDGPWESTSWNLIWSNFHTYFEVWPPPGLFLVAGPTPWGRDVPWAPPSWDPLTLDKEDAPR